MSAQPLKDRVVVITGASSGIGKALAQAFGLAGGRIVISARNPERLAETEAWLQQQGIEVLALVADVAQESDCFRLAAQTLNTWGRIDTLINNAGISMRALFRDLDTQVIRSLMETNFFGAVYLTKACLPALLRSKGSIVGISSIAGLRPLPARTGYSASKAALQGFLESLRTELLPTGVHVLMVYPGYTASNIRQVALGPKGSAQGESPLDESKLMPAETVAQATLQAVLKRKRSLVLTRQGKLTVLLQKLAPGWMDGVVYRFIAKEKDSPFR